MVNLNVLNQSSRPSLDHFRNMQQRMKKTPYIELPEGRIIMVSDEDEGDMDIMVELGVEFYKNKRVKEEALSVAKINAKLEHNIKKDMAAVAAENARKMSIIQEELRASNAKTDTIQEMLSKMQSFAAAPWPAYSFPAGYPFHNPFPRGLPTSPTWIWR